MILGDNGVSDNNILLAGTTGGASVNQTEQSNSATASTDGYTDGPEGNSIRQLGTDSLFNPFYIFRYSKFATGSSATNAGDYDFGKHKNKYNDVKLLSLAGKAQQLEDHQISEIQNPTASRIIAYSNAQAEQLSNHTGPLYPYPYALNDFLWCKWYGKIPNNRLLTLRRYTIPVEDNLSVAAEKLPLVPTAQAVTWWGQGTNNSLSSILGMTYGFNWNFDEKAKMEDVTGNEIPAESLLDAAGIPEGPVRKALIMAMGNNPSNPFQSSGYDATLQQFTKDSWEKGAYWNRVKGPVNVINTTAIRTQGYQFQQDIKLDFEYNLRSFGNINPKVAMLDLISNFLALTYNKAPFWGGGYRYYQRTGYILPGFNTDALEKGDYVQGMKDITAASGQNLTNNAAAMKKWWASVSNEIKGKDISGMATEIGEKLGNTKAVNDVLGARLAPLMQKPLVLRALLDGRAVGEWHLMVGNPLSPLAVIGNLCLKTTKMTFSEELGADDFPVSIKFSLTFESGRPRAKQDIESMFNLGGGDLSFTALSAPSSAMDSNGEYNGLRIASARGTTPGSADSTEAAALKVELAKSTATAAQTTSSAENLGEYFKTRVASKYGEGFGKSPILLDYFTKLQTKD